MPKRQSAAYRTETHRKRERLSENVDKIEYRCSCCGHSKTEYIDAQGSVTRARVKSAQCPECEGETGFRLRIIFHGWRGRGDDPW